MAERLGKGLQNLVQRFESASDLTAKTQQANIQPVAFFFCHFFPTFSPHLFGGERILNLIQLRWLSYYSNSFV